MAHSSSFGRRWLSLLFLAAGWLLSAARLPKDYVSLSAESKLDILWHKIMSTPYDLSSLPVDLDSPYPNNTLLFDPDFLQTTFIRESDEMPKGRKKHMTAMGTVAKVSLTILPDSSYTGLFKTGGSGLIRLSIRIHNLKHFMPMMGLKLLIDGKPSENIFGMNASDGQGSDLNYFKNRVSNIFIPATFPGLKFLSQKFKNATDLLPGGEDDHPDSAANMPLVEAASVEANGDAVDPSEIKAPYQVWFVPMESLQWPADDAKDFREHMADIPEGTVLYDVWATDRPNGTQTALGQVVTKSPFVASKYGDERLFFRHPRKRWTEAYGQSQVPVLAKFPRLY